MCLASFCLHPHRWLVLTAILVGSLPWLVGCEKSQPGPISARSSQYEVDDASAAIEPPAAGTPAATDRTGDPPDANAPAVPGERPPITTPDTAPRAPETSQPVAEMPPSEAAPVVEGQPPAPPAFDPADNLDLSNLDPNQLPNSEVKLLALLEVLQSRMPSGRTPQEQMEEFLSIQFTRVKAAEKLWELSKDKPTRINAVQTKLDALRLMSRFQVPDVEKQLNTFCRALQQHEDPDIAFLGRLELFGLAVNELQRGGPVDVQKLSEELKKMAAEAEKNPNTFMVFSEAANVFLRTGNREAAIEAYRNIGQAFQDSDDQELAADAAVMLQRVRILEAELDLKLQAVATGQPDSEAPLLDTLGALSADGKSGRGTLVEMGQIPLFLEMTDNYDLARRAYERIAAGFKDHADAELAEQAVQMRDNGLKHLDLVGKPLVVTGTQLDGSPFDWSAYKGKVVLVSFWTWSEPCLFEISNIIEAYRQYRDQGFAVVGVNLDQDTTTVKKFMDIQPLPWTIVVSADPAKTGADNPLAESCGVDQLPFAVLLDREGNVIALHARQDRLHEKLAELFGPPANVLPGAVPGNPPGANPNATPPGPAEGAPPVEGQSGTTMSEEQVYFVSAGMQPADEANDAEEAADAEIEAINPYSPRGDLSPGELVEFILNMQDKPKSLQERPGFSAALIEAADGILAAESSETQRRMAAETKFKLLHDQASLGNAEADAALAAFVEQMKDSQDERVAAAVRFFQLERRAIEVDDLPLEQVPSLLAELKGYLAAEKLDDRHLRMASFTVRAINRLEDESRREEYFREFGQLFTKSPSKELARYGKKLAGAPAASVPDLLGKPLEVAGVTTDGNAFEWKDYRGKIVLVDFWATWCGPCRAAMPQVRALYEELRNKGFEIVGVSLDKDQEALAKYLEENAIPWVNLAGDEAGELAKKYGISAIPTLVLVDGEGVVVAAGNKLDTLKPALDRLIAKED